MSIYKVSAKIPSGMEGLKQFAERYNDRSPPPYYAGRKRMLADIESTCTEIWQRTTHGQSQLKGATRLIYGAPGAGKSSTLIHLHDEWLAGRYAATHRDGTHRQGSTPIMLYSGDGHVFDFAPEFCQTLIGLVDPDNHTDFSATLKETVRKTGGLDLAMVTGKFETERTIESNIVDASLRTLANILPHNKWTRPLVIGVDEAQNLNGDQHSLVGHILQALHANHLELPILVVLAGLSDAKQRVAELGISRFSIDCTYSLECMNEDEIEELNQGFCSHFGIHLGNRNDEFNAMLVRTDGWPAHIQNCLRAFSKIYLQSNCNINRVDFAEVEKLSQAARMQYYHARMSDAMEESCQLLGSLMERLTGTERRGSVISLIKQLDRQNEGGDEATLSLPDYMNSLEFYETLIHYGALQERNNRTVFCPIPSFRQYMIEVGRQSQTVRLQSDESLQRGLPWDAIARIEASHQIHRLH